MTELRKTATHLTDEDRFLNRLAYIKMLKDVEDAEKDEELTNAIILIQQNKNIVNPFVLITKSDKVRMAYSKMINSHYSSPKNG